MSRMVALPPPRNSLFPVLVAEHAVERGEVQTLEWLDALCREWGRVEWSRDLAADARRAACFFAEVHA